MDLKKYLDYPEPTVALQSALGAAVTKLGRRALRRVQPATLGELATSASRPYVRADLLLEETFDLSRSSIEDLRSEHENARVALRRDSARSVRTFPEAWAIEQETSLLLYGVTRLTRPSLVLEMGVANGTSTSIVLSALEANGGGRLVSFDVEPTAGSLVPDRLRSGWELKLVDRARPFASLREQLEPLHSAGIAFHDAGHGYLSQRAEFEILWNSLAHQGVLVADDVDHSNAWLDFTSRHCSRAFVLIDTRKAVGVASRSAGSIASKVRP